MRRIEVLDGYRALAILLVMGYHYFSRWAPPNYPRSLYPYGDLLSDFFLFKYGYLGVELFFMISGFVITFTLTRSKNWYEFAIRRFARLFPAMLVCSLVSFAIIEALPTKFFFPKPIDFIPSLSFVDPNLLGLIFGKKFSSIDGVYWSLYVEVKFYIWACLFYFLVRGTHFLIVFSLFFNCVLALWGIQYLLDLKSAPFFLELVFSRSHLPWFVAGVAFYYIYRGERILLAGAVATEALVVIVISAVMSGWMGAIVFDLIFFALFALFIFRGELVQIFRFKPIALLGSASYSLYLLHQNIVVTSSAQIALWLDVWQSNYSVAITLMVACAVAWLSILIYRHWELPAKRVMLRISGIPQSH